MNLIKCENGHFYDSDRYLKCPHCDDTYTEMVDKTRSLFTWKADYSAQKMLTIKITSGNLPIKHILWNGETVTYYNRINGSRDGGLQFDDDFFDETVIQLSADERAQIAELLNAIDFSKWKTSQRTIELVAIGAAGFCPTDTFECEFKSGEQFYCYPSNVDGHATVSELHNLFYSMERILKPRWKEYRPSSRPEPELPAEPELPVEHFCPACGSKLRENAQFCSTCGKNAQMSTGETLLFCPVCQGSFQQSDNYCPDCGVRVKYFTDIEKPQDEEELKDAVYAFEKLIEVHQKDEKNNWILSKALELLYYVPLFFAVEIDTAAILGGIDPLSLKPGDTLSPQQDVRAKIKSVNLGELEVVPAFTKSAYIDTSVMRFYPEDYIDMLIKMGKPMVINLSQTFRFVVPVHYFEHMKQSMEKKTHLSESKLCPGCGLTISLNDAETLNFCPQCGAPLESSLTEKTVQEDLNIGKIIGGRYEIISVLPKRATGDKRYLLKDVYTQKLWETVEEPKSSFTLHLNSDALKRLGCPGIPRIADKIEQDGNIYLICEYIEGNTLFKIVSEYGAQPEHLVIDWAKQVACVLDYLYHFSPIIIHRDIKPQLLVLHPSGKLYVTDFSIARVYNPSKPVDSMAFGTVGYAAPEQYGNAQTDWRTDIFGLGMTLFHILTGMSPVKKDVKILPVRQYNAHISPGMEYIVEKCIQLDPNLRYQTPAQLLYDLEHITELPPKKGWFKKH